MLLETEESEVQGSPVLHRKFKAKILMRGVGDGGWRKLGDMKKEVEAETEIYRERRKRGR